MSATGLPPAHAAGVPHPAAAAAQDQLRAARRAGSGAAAARPGRPVRRSRRRTSCRGGPPTGPAGCGTSAPSTVRPRSSTRGCATSTPPVSTRTSSASTANGGSSAARVTSGDQHLDQPLDRPHRWPGAAPVQVHDGDAADQLARVPGVRRGSAGSQRRHGVDVGGGGQQPLDGGGLVVARRAREREHDRVDAGLGHDPGQAGDRPEQGERQAAGLGEGVAAPVPTKPTGLQAVAPGGRAGSARAAAPSYRCRRPAPDAGAVRCAAAGACRRRPGCARARGRPGPARANARRRPAGRHQDRRRGGRGHEQAGQVLEDREHQPGPVQVRGAGDEHGDQRGRDDGHGDAAESSLATRPASRRRRRRRASAPVRSWRATALVGARVQPQIPPRYLCRRTPQ